MARKIDTTEGTSRKRLAQVIVCEGCCCGRTDKGHPAVPTEWLKSEWRRRTLLKRVHLSVSGCVGPCDVSNVVVILTPDRSIWFGGIERHDQYRELVDWASACDRLGTVVPLPRTLSALEFERFHGQRLDREEVA